MMTIEKACRSALRRSSQPKYRTIAETIAAAIQDGALSAGARLPPQRELADGLRVTLGTVTRAYAELERRGLIAGDVGRGTYVRQRATVSANPFPSYDEQGVVHLDANHPSSDFADAFVEHCTDALADAEAKRIWDYAPRGGRPEHREAGALWLGRTGFRADPKQVVITAGAQQAILVALAALAQPGETVAVEESVFPGVVAAARFLRIELSPGPLDAHGLDPEAFRALCERAPPNALYCVPTLQNPTGSIMPISRRRELAEIARHHAVPIVEDDVYAPLLEAAPEPIASFCPELAWYLSSLSKSVAPGLRVGYLSVPPAELDKVQSLLMTTTLSPSPVTAELAAHAIRSGWADSAIAAQRATVRERWDIARRVLSRFVPERDQASPHLWLTLPKPWRAREFERACRDRGVAVAPAELFAPARASAPQAVRLSLCAPPFVELEPALRVVSELLEGRPAPAVLAV